ncbi:MAG: hypothetical protein K6G15_09005 [Desulfovibrio sp.]|nr:hypothetical protein [Desulfovibrio sp.]
MRTTLIRTIARAKINALAYQGIMPSECFAQIQETIRRHFDERHAQAFAEPVFNKEEGFVDWYVPFTGNVRCYQDLSEAEKNAQTAEFAALAADVNAYADELIAKGDPQKVTRGNLLKLALLYPSDDDLYVVDDRPVVTCWGFGPGSNDATVCNLCDLRVGNVLPVQAEQAPAPEPASKAPVVAVPVEEKKRAGCLAWLIPFLLCLAIAVLLFADFGRQKALSGMSLGHLPSLMSADEIRERGLQLKLLALDHERLELEEQALQLLAACRRGDLPKPTGILPPITQQEKPKPDVPPALLPEAPKEELVIPENVKDTGFLAGRWLCATGLFNSHTQEPVQVEFIFGSDGQGTGHIYEKNGRCSGPARASFQDNVLAIEHDALVCEGGSSYRANTIECRKSMGKTECHGINADGGQWKAVFLKLSAE